MTRQQLRARRRLQAPYWGVRDLAGAPSDIEARCLALATVLDDGVAFSHTTALRLLGIEVPWRLAADDLIHVTTLREEDRPQRADVVAHRSRQESLDVVDVGGLVMTSPAQTFVHVGCGLRLPDDVVVLGDSLLRRGRQLTTTAELAALAARTHKVKGIAQVREQIPRIRAGTDSSTESRTRLALIGASLPCPEINEVVTDPQGRYVKRVDMLYRRWQIAIEYDGDQHRTDQAQWREDVRARRRLEELGWIVIVVIAPDITGDPTPLIHRVRSAIASRTRTTPQWA